MVAEMLLSGSPLDQLNEISDIKESLKLSYPELESLVNKYGMNTVRIYPYLGYDSIPLDVEDYLGTVLNAMATPMREDYVRIALNILATPIREDYLRIALTNLATPIREDYLRQAVKAVAKSIQEDILRLVLNAVIRAIREDCLRTALNKFSNQGIEAQTTLTQISDIIQKNPDFIKYTPLDNFDLTGDPKIRYMYIREIGMDTGELVSVLDKEMYRVPLKKLGEFTVDDYSLFTNGVMGTDGRYIGQEFNVESIENVYFPLYDVFNPTPEKVPKEYWIDQARNLIDRNGWSRKNIQDLSRWNFKPYKGKKPSSKMMSKLRYCLTKEMEKRH